MKQGKPFDHYSEDERQEIIFWQRIVEEWQDFRHRPGAKLDELDNRYVEYCKMQYPDISISVKTLYHKWKALKDNDLDALVDKRGKARKGKSKITEEMWQVFLSYYLDETQHPIQKCYEYTRLYFQKLAPEIAADMPEYHTFWRKTKSDIPKPVEVLGREGHKAFQDRCAPFIPRFYGNMASNDKCYDELRQDIKQIMENHLTKDDFIREISQLGRKTDAILDYVMKQGGKGQ